MHKEQNESSSEMPKQYRGRPDLRGWVTTVFGLSVITSGLWRYFSAEGGEAGLWFGLVMGGLALVAAGLFFTRKQLPATILVWLCIAFVGGWFCYESFIKKGFANAETRQLIIIGLTGLTALFHLSAIKKRSSTSS